MDGADVSADDRNELGRSTGKGLDDEKADLLGRFGTTLVATRSSFMLWGACDWAALRGTKNVRQKLQS